MEDKDLNYSNGGISTMTLHLDSAENAIHRFCGGCCLLKGTSDCNKDCPLYNYGIMGKVSTNIW